jgi:hypothetical protein
VKWNHAGVEVEAGHRVRAKVALITLGTPREPEHSNEGVLTPRSLRILRHDQCALCVRVLAAEALIVEQTRERTFTEESI